MREIRLGTEELRLLRLVAEVGPMSVRSASESYGAVAGVRLTTVGKMMERLRHKGFLHRRLDEGVYLYESTVDPKVLLESVVRDFVQSALGGSVAPLALYLAQKRTITQDELDELRRAVDMLESRS